MSTMQGRSICVLVTLGISAFVLVWYFTGRQRSTFGTAVSQTESFTTAMPEGSLHQVHEMDSRPPAGNADDGQLNPQIQELDAVGSAPTEANEAIGWAVGDLNQLRQSEKVMFRLIYQMRKSNAADVPRELSLVVSQIEALANLLDNTPRPFVSANVLPPVFRDDGTPYPSQTLAAGMAPGAIHDPEQREAYMKAIRKRNEEATLRNWHINASTVHKTLHSSLEDELAFLVKKGIVNAETQKASLATTKRRSRK